MTYTLDGYFQDGDGDSLTYSIEAGEEGRAGLAWREMCWSSLPSEAADRPLPSL